MKPLPHRYDVQLAGGPAGYGRVSSAGLPELRTAPPADYDGPGDAWSPEHLLLASVETCFLFTLRPIARLSKVDFGSIELDATGTVARQDHTVRFTEIVLHVRLTVPAGTDRDHVRHVLDRCGRACLVSASLSTPVRLEADIQEAAESIPAVLRSA